MEDTINYRLKTYIEYKQLSYRQFAIELGYSSSEKLSRLLRNPENKPSYDIIFDIANKFDELNIDWLITGRGAMLKTEINKEYNECVDSYNSLVLEYHELAELNSELLNNYKEKLEENKALQTDNETFVRQYNELVEKYNLLAENRNLVEISKVGNYELILELFYLLLNIPRSTRLGFHESLPFFSMSIYKEQITVYLRKVKAIKLNDFLLKRAVDLFCEIFKTIEANKNSEKNNK